jgi:hypothetical protein
MMMDREMESASTAAAKDGGQVGEDNTIAGEE